MWWIGISRSSWQSIFNLTFKYIFASIDGWTSVGWFDLIQYVLIYVWGFTVDVVWSSPLWDGWSVLQWLDGCLVATMTFVSIQFKWWHQDCFVFSFASKRDRINALNHLPSPHILILFLTHSSGSNWMLSSLLMSFQTCKWMNENLH